jgi:hypothetical protein
LASPAFPVSPDVQMPKLAAFAVKALDVLVVTLIFTVMT